MDDVIIEIRGGNLQEVYSSLRGILVTVVDWDHAHPPNADDCVFRGVPPDPIEMMPRDKRDLIEASDSL